MRKNWPVIIFWVVFAALMFATMQNESMRIELREGVERNKKGILENTTLLEGKVKGHTHRYYDGEVAR